MPTQRRVPLTEQIRHVLGEIERTLLLIEGRRRYQRHYDQLRGLRDQLEASFDRLQVAQLRDGAVDFGEDVARLKEITSDLEAATKRAARTKEILGYIAASVELVSQVVKQVLAFI